jgi:hypothetical protein
MITQAGLPLQQSASRASRGPPEESQSLSIMLTSRCLPDSIVML